MNEYGIVSKSHCSGMLWPEVMVQLNPAFKPGRNTDQLIEAGVFHPDVRGAFSLPDGTPWTFHIHQDRAFESVKSGKNLVMTTGTGSGKSLCYIGPVIDEVVRKGSGNGIKALVIYPMNALVNSQKQELENFYLPRVRRLSLLTNTLVKKAKSASKKF